MTHGSLFSGIGGFDLAAQWLGWENVFHCEWNPFGQRVLKHYWPNADSHHDITKTNFTQYANRIDILTGGFPCQPYSAAGKRKGKEDERHLWPEMLRVIREVAPRYVVGENVLGLTNWNGGLVFDEVHTDLESAGYEVAAVVIPAAAVNAPHGRDRVWFVAKRVVADAVCGSDGNDGGEIVGAPSEIRRGTSVNVPNQFCGTGVVADASDNEYGLQTEGWLGMEQNPLDRRERKKETNGFGNDGEGRVVADASGERLQRRDGQNIGEFPTTHGTKKFGAPTKWETFPTKPAVCSGNDGVPDQLDGITFSKWRFESLKAYGNAIVPQVAYEIFKTIQRIEDGQTTT
jgi:DNA (cytosine-5)-methyltransferase 1